MSNEELFEMFRASGEVSFPVFLDKYIEWEESNETSTDV